MSLKKHRYIQLINTLKKERDQEENQERISKLNRLINTFLDKLNKKR